ncbi:hypothetical protein [Streptomyces sediminimaris]|uniref:hypothetical protein n=1 Tax=Streptomyces sediminimaris TaxID=3383721 RepID=UPI00399B4613
MLWLEDDRAWALALAAVEASECPDCRQPWDEATARGSEGAWQAEITRCHACAAAAAKVGQFESAGGDMRGLHVHVTRR